MKKCFDYAKSALAEMPRPTMGTRTIRLKPDSTIGAVTALLLTSGMAFAQGGPYERQRVDNAADRGRAVYAKHCINCHGSTAKGTDRGRT